MGVEEGLERSLQQIGASAVVLSLDLARLIRHRQPDCSVLWIQAATSAEQILTLALDESAGRRDSDGTLLAARNTLRKFLLEKEKRSESIAA
jgi:hypothetical protein